MQHLHGSCSACSADSAAVIHYTEQVMAYTLTAWQGSAFDTSAAAAAASFRVLLVMRPRPGTQGSGAAGTIGAADGVAHVCWWCSTTACAQTPNSSSIARASLWLSALSWPRKKNLCRLQARVVVLDSYTHVYHQVQVAGLLQLDVVTCLLFRFAELGSPGYCCC
jgi:hypothetical protein